MKTTTKLITSTIAALLLSTNLMAAEKYLGVKMGTLSTDKTVYGEQDTGEPLIKYDDVQLIGLEMSMLRDFKSSFLTWGLGLDIMLNEGNFLDSGKFDLDFKFGGHYKDFTAYALAGAGIQSLSSVTVATGFLYGAGINYDIFKHMSAKVEYRTHDLSTTDNGDLEKQTYTLSGVTATFAYKF